MEDTELADKLDKLPLLLWEDIPIQKESSRRIRTLSEQVHHLSSGLIAAGDVVEKLEALLGVISYHDVESLSCDRDGEKYCDCLSKAFKKASDAVMRYKGLK